MSWRSAVLRTALTALRYTPRPLAGALSRACTKALDFCVPRLRRTARTNLVMALPEADADTIIDGVFASIARMLVAFARFPDLHPGNINEWISYDGYEHFAEAKRRGRGVLFATAHLGAWELSAFAHALMSEPMHIVVRPIDDPDVDAVVERRRALSGNRIIAKKDAAKSILKALHANEAVGILIDQNAGLDDGIFVPFFGVPASANAAFVRIAHRTGAAVIPGFALWDAAADRFKLRFEPILELTGDVHADTARLHSVFERVIREHPDQWLWLHRRWKTRPPGEPALY